MSGSLVIRSAARGVSDSLIPLSATQLMRRHLTAIRSALPYDAAQILVFVRSVDEHRQMAQIGYPPEVARVMAEEFTKDWPRPVWQPVESGDDLPPTVGSEQDLPGSFRQSVIYREYLHPAGFRDGLTLELNHRGRYVGLANFSSFTDNQYTNELRQRSLAFASLLGHAVNDTARDLEAVPPSARATIVDQTGRMSGLAGREPSTLVRHADFLEAIQPLFETSQNEVTFLWNVGRQWFRVSVRQANETGDNHQPRMIIEQPIDRPSGLTPMEIRVVTRLISCTSNEGIATSLGIGVRTVHSHISSILAKLNSPRRTQAVASALRNGLFRPEPNPEGSLTHLLQ